MNCPNVPRSIAIVVSRNMATMAELSTVLGAQDLYDMIEIAMVMDHNAYAMSEA